MSSTLVERLIAASDEIYRRTIRQPRSVSMVYMPPAPKFKIGDLVRLSAPETLVGGIGRIESFQLGRSVPDWLYWVVINGHRDDTRIQHRELLPEEFLTKPSLLEIMARESL